MSAEDLKTLSRRAVELLNSDNQDRPEDLVTETYLNHQIPDAAGDTSPENPWDWKEVLESYHEDVVDSGQAEPDARGSRTRDRQGWFNLLKRFHDGFSDSKVDILSQIADDDMVATRWRITATHTGRFAGYRPTRLQSTWTGVTTDRFEGGRIAESWVNWDKYTFLQGLGLVR